MNELAHIKDPIRVSEAMRITGYSAEYVRRLARQGHIVAVKWENDWILSRDSIIKWQRDNRRP